MPSLARLHLGLELCHVIVYYAHVGGRSEVGRKRERNGEWECLLGLHVQIWQHSSVNLLKTPCFEPPPSACS